MIIPQRTTRIVDQAIEQWKFIGEWLGANSRATSTGIRSRLAYAGRGLVAICWRLGIGLALIASLVIDVVAIVFILAVEFIDSLLGWPLALVCAPVELLFSIPYLGRSLGWLWKAVLSVAWGSLHLLELPLVFLSVMPARRLRLWVVAAPEVVESAHGLENWLQSIEVAAKVFQREANIHLVPVRPFQPPIHPSGGQDPYDEYRWIWRSRVSSEGKPLAVECNLEALTEDLGPLGGQLERTALTGHPRGAYRRVSGWGAPLMAVAVHSVAAGTLAGCSLGPLTDYVTVRQDQPICLAHEVGHACNLPHSSSPDNLMNPTCGGVHLSRWQVFLLRLSRHVTYL